MVESSIGQRKSARLQQAQKSNESTKANVPSTVDIKC